VDLSTLTGSPRTADAWCSTWRIACQRVTCTSSVRFGGVGKGDWVHAFMVQTWMGGAVSDETGSPHSTLRRSRVFLDVVGALTILLGATGGVANALGLSEVGPAAAEVMLDTFGDPCDGVLHPGYQTAARGAIVDGVQAHLGADTEVPWLVEKVAEKDGWAYIETAPPDGFNSVDYAAYILRRDDDVWEVRWTGSPGAQAGNPTGDPYPRGFDSSDQDILRCPTVCNVGGS